MKSGDSIDYLQKCLILSRRVAPVFTRPVKRLKQQSGVDRFCRIRHEQSNEDVWAGEPAAVAAAGQRTVFSPGIIDSSSRNDRSLPTAAAEPSCSRHRSCAGGHPERPEPRPMSLEVLRVPRPANSQGTGFPPERASGVTVSSSVFHLAYLSAGSSLKG
jgi:hypothetical protein